MARASTHSRAGWRYQRRQRLVGGDGLAGELAAEAGDAVVVLGSRGGGKRTGKQDGDQREGVDGSFRAGAGIDFFWA